MDRNRRLFLRDSLFLAGTGLSQRFFGLAEASGNVFPQATTTGNPNHKGLPEWRPYDLKARSTMSFTPAPRLVDDPRGNERRLIELVPYTQPGT